MEAASGRRDIGVERLAATATVQRCIACERLHDRGFAGGAGVTL
jgi:hypothetical protein